MLPCLVFMVSSTQQKTDILSVISVPLLQSDSHIARLAGEQSHASCCVYQELLLSVECVQSVCTVQCDG